MCLNIQGDDRNSLAKLEYDLNVLREEKALITEHAVAELKPMFFLTQCGILRSNAGIACQRYFQNRDEISGNSCSERKIDVI